ncbi:GNAT superfamily N-acetyltransferase [Marmoricola sp. OAE513]|uniref:GNAT family N-acetyltransferase n=1 Tax=Marmoricola sp. OAE513 TaxID=2817894 RepID=UPI001AEAFD96
MELFFCDPDDLEAVSAYVGAAEAARAVDAPWEQAPTITRIRAEMRHGFDGEPGEHYLLRADGRVVGTAAIFVSDRDNRELAWVELVVLPEVRRRGHGRAALALVLDRCLAIGRPLIVLYGWESDAARRFAAAAGFELESTEIRRLLELTGTADQDAHLRSVRDAATARAGGYHLVRFTGRTPADLLPDLVRVTAAINDAPRDGLEYEDELYDVDRVRAYESAQVEAGRRLYRVVASTADGEMVGHTAVSVDSEDPTWADQHDTAVVPEHRGRRLGLLLKSSMALWLRDVEPQLRWVGTENAESNGPMIDVNEELGYRVAGRQLLFQRRLRFTPCVDSVQPS